MKSAARPPHQPAAVPAPLAGTPPSHQPGRAAAGLACLDFVSKDQALAECAAALAEAQARAEHWVAQADRLAGQVEAMRAVMLEVAEELGSDYAWPRMRPARALLADRLRRAAGGEGEP